jgi:hypothetical protein
MTCVSSASALSGKGRAYPSRQLGRGYRGGQEGQPPDLSDRLDSASRYVHRTARSS